MVLKNLMKRIFSGTAQGDLKRVKITGLKKVKMNPDEAENFHRILADQTGKLRRAVKNEFNLKVDLRQHSKTGNRHKWSVKLRINFPGKFISAEETAWKLEEAVNKSFENLKKRTQHYFKGNVRGQNLKRQPKIRKKV